MTVIIKNTRDIFEKMRNPSPLFRLMVWDDEKCAKWAHHLLYDPLHVSDERKTEECVMSQIKQLLLGDAINVIYEIGDFSGVIGFYNIVPSTKGYVTLVLWDTSVWSKGNLRETEGLIDYIMETFDLRRLETETADYKIVRLAKMLGFELEGEKRWDFCHNGEFISKYILGLVRPGGGGNNV